MAAQAGMYIAWGPWLGPALYKVGHTANLARRLQDGEYTTCFPPGHWRYEATYEVSSAKDAARLEAYVLAAARHRRLGTRELVRAALADLEALAAAGARDLSIAAVRRPRPSYVLPAAPAKAAPAASESPEARLSAAEATLAASRALPPWGEADDLLADLFAELELGPGPGAVGPGAVGPGAVGPGAVGPGAEPGAVGPPAGPGPEPEAGNPPAEVNPYRKGAITLRDYQAAAAEACREELRREGRTILQMACRCGKTPIAASIAAEFLAEGKSVLFQVPGLALLAQTAQKLASYGIEVPTQLIGSAGPVATGQPQELPLGMTTDAAEIGQFAAAAGPKLAISTYQSSRLVPQERYDLVVSDEAHRICGPTAERAFSAVALAPQAGQARLYMTATPVYGDRAGFLGMDNRAVFGGVAYRYHLRQGIEAGHVSDFQLRLVAPQEGGALAGQIAAASRESAKLLVFCRDTAHAERLCEATRPALPPGAWCGHAHSRMKGGEAKAALRAFAGAAPPAILFNCRLFQEGVEIPELDGVFFAAARHSPRDIVQSLCRPLNRHPGKAGARIFIPLTLDAEAAPEAPANLKRLASILPFIDALAEEDPRLYEHLLNPRGVPYPLAIAGAPGARGAQGAPAEQILAAVRRVARHGPGGGRGGVLPERLLTADKAPFDVVFAEIRRTVVACGRYPKTTDLIRIGEATVSLHAHYRRLADACARGLLEPYQRAALEALPGWKPYGLEGPFPWGECMAFLEGWIAEHGSPPEININNGGYIGLEATPMERLSGCLTCVNQNDGKRGMQVAAEKQAFLDDLCRRRGLTWRKPRTPAGELVEGAPPTFIQGAYARFKGRLQAEGPGGAYIQKWFPGYPEKHRIMERPEVRAAGDSPPRKPGRRPARPNLKKDR